MEGVGSQAGLHRAAFPNRLGSSEITIVKLMPTHRPGQDSKKEVSLPTGLPAPAPWRSDNSEISCGQISTGGRVEAGPENPRNLGVPAVLYSGGDTLGTDHSPGKARELEAREPVTDRLGMERRGQTKEEAVEPRATCVKDGRGRGCSGARRVAEGAGGRARVRGLPVAAGE